MDRRSFLQLVGISTLSSAGLVGCRSKQVAHVLEHDDKDMVGSHTAGAETWKPLIDESVAKLLGRQTQIIQPVSHQGESASLGLKNGFVSWAWKTRVQRKLATSKNRSLSTSTRW